MKISHHDSLMKAELVTARFSDLIKIRFPWLVICLAGGLIASLIVSRFEMSIRENVALAFFIPIIANLSDAIGTQTETIFIRALADLKFDITKYILREIFVGGMMGTGLGVIAFMFAYILSGSAQIGFIVGLSLVLSMTAATVIACVTPIVLRFLGKDPAVGSGPFTTSLQDIVGLTVYFTTAYLVLN